MCRYNCGKMALRDDCFARLLNFLIIRTFHIVILLSVAFASTANAKQLIVAPGADAGRYASIEEALHSATDGDRILLPTGTYGDLVIDGVNFASSVVIEPQMSSEVHATSIHIRNSSGLVLRGFNVWPTKPGMRPKLVRAEADTDRISIERMDIRGSQDAPDSYMTWTKSDWNEKWAAMGITLDGTNSAAIGNRITGIGFGITTSGPQATVRGNFVKGFSADALRGLGDRSIFSDNRVEDAFDTDDNHDDGFQAWARFRDSSNNKVLTGLVVERNSIIEWTGDDDHPLRSELQGIGLFDGIYDGIIVQNNLVVVSGWHGISIYGARKGKIVNNTVVFPGGDPSERPWILVGPTKSGINPGGNTVANNISMSYRKIPEAFRANALIKYQTKFLYDPARYNFYPKPESGLVGTADPNVAPIVDITGEPRNFADKADFGAFQTE